MAEHNFVVKQLKDGKLSEKPCAGEKSDIWQDFVHSFITTAMIVHQLFVIVLVYVAFKIYKFFVDIS